MAMRLALTGEPPPSRHWDDPDLDTTPAEQKSFSLHWNGDSTPATFADDASLLIAASPVSVALVRQLLLTSREEHGWAGAFTLLAQVLPSEVDAGRLPSPPPPGQAEVLASLDGRTFLVVVDGFRIPPEDCFTWTRTLLQGIKLTRAVILGPLPASHFHGQLRANLGVEDLASTTFRLETSQFQRQDSLRDALKALPFLPPGALVDGLPASLLSHFQVRSLSAVLCCCGPTDPSPGFDSKASLAALAATLQSCLPLINMASSAHLNIGQLVQAAAWLTEKSHPPSEMYI